MAEFMEWLEQRRTEGLGPVLSLLLIAAGLGGVVWLAWQFGGGSVGQTSSSFEGRNLEDLRLLDAEGNTHRLGDLKGRVVVLDFWATWCPPCRMSLPELAALQSKQTDRYAVVPVSLDRGGFQDVLPFFKQNPQFDLFALVPADPGALASKVGPIRGIPTTLIITRAGKVAHAWAGYAPGRLEQELLAELKRP